MPTYIARDPGLAEALHFGKQAGMYFEAEIEEISKGSAKSWQIENRYKTMNDGNSGDEYTRCFAFT